MIKSLNIDNFALISELELSFHPKFTTITGETGSGKSILLGALNLILGQRADFSLIGAGKEKTVVEAVIDIRKFEMYDFFTENELDYFEETIVRREIYKQGRSRAFINDIPVQLATLKSFTSNLIQIHSQYNTLELKDHRYQLYVLDILANSVLLKSRYNEVFLEWKRLGELLKVKEIEYAELVSSKDYNEFQKNELDSLNLNSIRYNELKSQLSAGENAEELKTALSALLESLQSDSGILDQLVGISGIFGKSSGLNEELDQLANRINSIILELKDVESDAIRSFENVEISGDDMIDLASKLDSFNRALHKHNLNSQEELIDLAKNLDNEAFSSDRLKSEIERLKEDIDRKYVDVQECAKGLSLKRSSATSKIEASITTILSDLKLPDTTLEFRLSERDEFGINGIDMLEIFFQPNKGLVAVPIHKAASGGELSRVMLSLQFLMSTKVQLKTILFDEIDTGVSGDVAQRVGDTLRKMGEDMQVIAITHLPQVAAKGIEHLKVVKETKKGKTTTAVYKLDDDGRVEETARLMSGAEINEAALANAKELMTK
jgi:DNA repair protein RecN (Recombination protein N)